MINVQKFLGGFGGFFFLSFFSFISCFASYQRFSIEKEEFIKKFQDRCPYFFWPSYYKKGFDLKFFLRYDVFKKKKKLKVPVLKTALENYKKNIVLHDTCLLSPEKFNKLECSICFEAKKRKIVTPCGHIFCRGCLVRHYCSLVANNACCPMCRKKFCQDLISWLRKGRNFSKYWGQRKLRREIRVQNEIIDILRDILSEYFGIGVSIENNE